VNTVSVRRSGSGFELSGYNTDAEGFRRSLPSDLKHSHALILGTGGSSKAVAYILRKSGIAVLAVSRTKKSESTITYEEIDRKLLERYTFIVNCTPVGMFPHIDTDLPLPFNLLNQRHFVYDLVYNPAETGLLRIARDAGAKTQNGLKMLELQADLSFEIWMSSQM